MISRSDCSPLDDSPAEREVVVNNLTLIVSQAEKPSEEYQKELAEFRQNASARAGGGETQVPDRYAENKIALSDLSVGKQVMVEAWSDISKTGVIIAHQITVLPQ